MGDSCPLDGVCGVFEGVTGVKLSVRPSTGQDGRCNSTDSGFDTSLSLLVRNPAIP